MVLAFVNSAPSLTFIMWKHLKSFQHDVVVVVVVVVVVAVVVVVVGGRW